MRELVFLLASFIITKTAITSSVKKMKDLGLTSKNYLGMDLPMPGGLLPITIYLLLLGLDGFLNRPDSYLLLMIFLGVTLLGILDDLKGNRGVKGFRGHFKSLLKGEITTGAAKAIGGFFLASISAWFFGEREYFAVALVINSLLISLSANLINLLDLRPGRAAKVFLFFAFLIAIFFAIKDIYWLYGLVGAILAYLPWDLKLKTMLGDTGANLLGFALGLALVICLTTNTKIVIVFALIIIHLYTERISLSKIIEKNNILNFLDGLGRLN